MTIEEHMIQLHFLICSKGSSEIIYEIQIMNSELSKLSPQGIGESERTCA